MKGKNRQTEIEEIIKAQKDRPSPNTYKPEKPRLKIYGGMADKSPRKSVFDDIEFLGAITPAPFSSNVKNEP